jgi:hypothetical protein
MQICLDGESATCDYDVRGNVEVTTLLQLRVQPNAPFPSVPGHLIDCGLFRESSQALHEANMMAEKKNAAARCASHGVADRALVRLRLSARETERTARTATP